MTRAGACSDRSFSPAGTQGAEAEGRVSWQRVPRRRGKPRDELMVEQVYRRPAFQPPSQVFMDLTGLVRAAQKEGKPNVFERAEVLKAVKGFWKDCGQEKNKCRVFQGRRGRKEVGKARVS